MLWPLANMFYISMVHWDGLLSPQNFIGLQNYTLIIHDQHFYHAVQNTGIHLLVGLPATLFPAFMLGFFLSQRQPGYRILRTIFFTPAMLSVAAATLMFLGIYLPDGILNTMLEWLGFSNLTRVWLGNTSTVLGAIIAIDVWSGIGFYSVMFFAVLSNLPPELYEAARLDGANLWNIMWRVAFPLTLDFFGVAAMLHFLWILLGSAQNVLLLTKGGPGDYSLTLGYYLYDQAFVTRRLGYSQAIAVIAFVMGLLGILAIRSATRRNYEI